MVANTLAYYYAAKITALTSLIVQVPGERKLHIRKYEINLIWYCFNLFRLFS
jgi:hypothetical protein